MCVDAFHFCAPDHTPVSHVVALLEASAATGGGYRDVVRVYIYEDVPSLDHSNLVECYRNRHGGVPPWQDERADMAQDMGEIWLHRYGRALVLLAYFIRSIFSLELSHYNYDQRTHRKLCDIV